MSGAPEGGSPSMSMLSEVSGMDNSLSLAEIDRIIGNLIGKEVEQNMSLMPDEHQSFVSDLSALSDAGGPRGGAQGVPESPNASAHFEDIPAVEASPQAPRASLLSPALQRLLQPKSLSSPSAGVDTTVLDSPTDVPSYVSPPPAPAGVFADSRTREGGGRAQRARAWPRMVACCIQSCLQKLTRLHTGNGMRPQEHFSGDAGAREIPRPSSWDASSSQSGTPQLIKGPTTAPSAAPGLAQMPLQKITLFRKAIDGDSAPSSHNLSIGISCKTDAGTGHVVITEVVPGGAAYNSGQVYPSDTLLQINGNSVTGMPTDKVLNLLAGEAGTPVSILVSHNPKQLDPAPYMPPPEPLRQMKSPLPSREPPPSRAAPPAQQQSLSEAEQEAEERRLVREKVSCACDRDKLLLPTGIRDLRCSCVLEARPARASTRVLVHPFAKRVDSTFDFTLRCWQSVE